jgi:hypothetical protein
VGACDDEEVTLGDMLPLAVKDWDALCDWLNDSDKLGVAALLGVAF